MVSHVQFSLSWNFYNSDLGGDLAEDLGGERVVLGDAVDRGAGRVGALGELDTNSVLGSVTEILRSGRQDVIFSNVKHSAVALCQSRICLGTSHEGAIVVFEVTTERIVGVVTGLILNAFNVEDGE